MESICVKKWDERFESQLEIFKNEKSFRNYSSM